MEIVQFATEQFFARYEFTTPYQLCNSDCETVSVAELLRMADIPLAQLGQVSLGYTESLGNPELRERIAALYDQVSSQEVVVLGSPVEGIYLVAQAALEPGDEVVVLSPAYDALINLFEHVVSPANVSRWSFTPNGSRWELDFERLDDLISPKTRLLVVNFPHNPTGYLPTQGQLETLAATVEEHDLLLFCDEMYAGLVHSGTPPVRSAADIMERAVVLSGLSKTYGLPGLRSGWLVVRDERLRQRIVNWKFYTSICPPAPSEFLALAALKVARELRARSIAQVEHNLGLAEAFFARWPDTFTWRRPLAGSTALVGMSIPSVTVFAARLAEEAGVLILPATFLGADDQHMRMGFGRRAFGEALEKFEAYLQSQLEKSHRRRQHP